MSDPRVHLLILALALSVPASAAGALDLSLPGKAVLTREEASIADTYFMPTGPYSDGTLPAREVEGQIIRQAWRIEGEDLTTLKLISAMREQLDQAGYQIVFDCTARECGGFDFRFNTSVMPAPDMFVDLFDFRFLSARKSNGEGADFVTCLVSLSGGTGYVQLVAVGAGFETRIAEPAAEAVSPSTAPEDGDGGLVARLVREGHVVLSDLVFASGSAELDEGPYASLDALSEFLKADKERRIALVGHTDAVGKLDANLALSHERAGSVARRLTERHGVPQEQIQADGVGFLAPVASNATAGGREANRRVEAVLLSAGKGG